MIEQAFPRRFAALLLTLTGVACDADECTAGRAGCDANIAENCVTITEGEFDSHTTWSRDDCGDALCLTPPEGLTEAFCALDESPDPECPEELRSLRDASRCVDGAVVTWRYGYRADEFYCVEGKACVDISVEGFDPTCGAQAFCSGLSAPEPLCQPGVGTACRGDSTISYCACGFSRSAHACENPGPSCKHVNLGGGLPDQGVCR